MNKNNFRWFKTLRTVNTLLLVSAEILLYFKIGSSEAAIGKCGSWLQVLRFEMTVLKSNLAYVRNGKLLI